MRSLLLVVALAHLSPPSQPAEIVERGRVGTIAIGASVGSIYAPLRDRVRLVDLKLEGMFSPALEVKRFTAQVTPSLVAEIGPAGNEFVVTRISVVDPALRTREGIGVGSTYEELRSRYTIDWVGSGEGGYYARVEALAISFQLDSSRHPDLWRVKDPTSVPGDIRVVSLLLTR